MMTDASRHRSRTLIAAVFLLLICCAGSGLWLAWEKQNAENWVRHTFEVSERLSKVRILTLRAEMSRRGYLLTGDPVDRAAVTEARDAVGGATGIRQLDELLFPAEEAGRSYRVEVLISDPSGAEVGRPGGDISLPQPPAGIESQTTTQSVPLEATAGRRATSPLSYAI